MEESRKVHRETEMEEEGGTLCSPWMVVRGWKWGREEFQTAEPVWRSGDATGVDSSEMKAVTRAEAPLGPEAVLEVKSPRGFAVSNEDDFQKSDFC